jgi:hypothetical protein
MKTLAVSMLLAFGLAAPAFAMEPPAAPAPAPVAADPSADALPDDPHSLDILTYGAIAPEDRIKMLARCAGPPPRLVASAPKSEPAVVAEAPAAPSTGG